MNIQDMPIVTNEQIMDFRKAAIKLKQENTAYAITVQNLEAELARFHKLIEHGLLCGTCNGIGQVGSPPDDYYDCPDCISQHNKIKADAINDLISSKFTNVCIEGCEWPVIYVEDAHVYANNLESKK